MYQHILACTDLTPEGKLVADKAKALAGIHNAKLSMVNVVEFSPLMYGGGEFAIPLDADLEDTIENQAKEELLAEGQRLGIAENNQFILSGSAKDAIVQLTQEIKVDAIVVGSHDHHGLALLLGSTANALLHAMPCDIIAVKLPTE